MGGLRVWLALAMLATGACRAKSKPSPTPDGGAIDKPNVEAGTGGASSSVRADAAVKDGRVPPVKKPPLKDGGDRVDADVLECTSPSASDRGISPKTSLPSSLGVLVGPRAAQPLGDLRLHGTDLGFSFEHDGELILLFGDTLKTPDDSCLEELNDDTIATVPLSFDGTVPKPIFRTDPDQPNEFDPMRLMRGGKSLELGFAQAPLTGFSDGEHALALFDRLELPRCTNGACASDGALTCSTRLGECAPASNSVVPPLCDIAKQTGCFTGETCVPTLAAVCVDQSSSQFDGTTDGEVAAASGIVEWGLQRDGERGVFDSVLSFRTNKFMSATSRTIERLDDDTACNDYGPGHNELLIWGRPRYTSQGEREAQLYLMRHSLPLTFAADGQVEFQPRYFAGVDPATNEPSWSTRQDEAKALAMDDVVDGSPHEPMRIVNHTAISWLGAPINKWMMLYGGGLSALLLPEGLSLSDQAAPGAVLLRFADHPWGPWSPPEPHLVPGSPTTVGDPYGPGGFLHHPDCRDTAEARCTPPDASLRDPMSSDPVCGINYVLWDTGQLYGANIIDAYTKPNTSGGMDVIWSVSTWNPYSVVLLKTTVEP